MRVVSSFRRTTRSATSSRCAGACARRCPTAEVLVVDDASPDGTADAARRSPRDLGPIDADRPGGQGRPRRGVPRRLPGGAGSAAPTCACNSMPICHTIRPWCRRWSPTSSTAPTWRSAAGTCPAAGRWTGRGSDGVLSRWGNRYAAGVLGLAVNDATSGFRAYSADALRRMDYETVIADGYGFQVEMTHRLVGDRRPDRRVPDHLQRAQWPASRS